MFQEIVNDYLNELYDHVDNGYTHQLEKEYQFSQHDISIVCDRTTEKVIVYEKDGTDVTSRYPNICKVLQKKLTNAWLEAEEQSDRDNAFPTDWEQFGRWG